MSPELFSEGLGVPVRILRCDLKLGANPVPHDTGERRSPVGALPNDGRDVAQGEECRIRR